MHNIALGVSNISIGILIIIFCIPLIKRKIKMNRWYGIRIPKSLESEKNWYKINEYGGKIFIYWSILIISIGIITLFLPPLKGKGLLILSLFPIVIIVPTIQIIIYSKKI